MDLDDELMLRYSRQIMLPTIDIAGQEALQRANVLIMGVGGLGSPVALYLAASGVGNLWISDPDKVDVTNLQRQIAHTTENINQSKVLSAKQQMKAINPHVKVLTFDHALKDQALIDAVKAVDVVVDATDNLTSRLLINAACVQQKTPLVSAAAIRWEGQITTFDSRQSDSPCYQCLYGTMGEVGQNCSDNGVVGSVVGTIGCLQATEVIKLICDVGKPLVGKVIFYDALNVEWRTMLLKRDMTCRVCGEKD